MEDITFKCCASKFGFLDSPILTVNFKVEEGKGGKFKNFN
jgi:hypothetical protein